MRTTVRPCATARSVAAPAFLPGCCSVAWGGIRNIIFVREEIAELKAKSVNDVADIATGKTLDDDSLLADADAQAILLVGMAWASRGPAAAASLHLSECFKKLINVHWYHLKKRRRHP